MNERDRPRYVTASSAGKGKHNAIPGSEAYAFCEPSTASSLTRWHIRKLDEAGRKPGGGITTPSCCGMVVPRDSGGLGGWDLEVLITPYHLQHACSKCVAALLAELAKASDG